MQRIIRAVLVRELVRVLKGWNTALYLLIAIAAKVKVDMHTDRIIAEIVSLHISPRNCQRSMNLEEENTHIMMSEVARLRRYRLMVVLMCLFFKITQITTRLPATPTTKMAAYRQKKITCTQ